MTYSHAGLRPRRAWSWTGAIGALILAGTWAAPGLAQSGPPVLTQRSGNGQVVIATGPFGRAAGLELPQGGPQPDATTLEALDAYGRGAKVVITPTTGSFDQWRATAAQEPALDSAPWMEIGSGSGSTRATIRLPSSGLFLVRADGTVVDPLVPGDPGTRGSWVWRIAVPDRDVPEGGDPYPPAPAIVLASGDRVVDLDPGSGCYVGTCGDIGATSPPRTLPTIRTLAGAPLTVRLSDDSGIASWALEATPLGGTGDQTVILDRGSSDPPVHVLTVPAPAEGRWVILVHVRFDRDRGSFDGFGRLILRPNELLGTGRGPG